MYFYTSTTVSCKISILHSQANEDVVQAVEVMYKGEQKWSWLLQHIVEFTSGGSVLIFVTKKTNSEELAKNLKENGHQCKFHCKYSQQQKNATS